MRNMWKLFKGFAGLWRHLIWHQSMTELGDDFIELDGKKVSV